MQWLLGDQFDALMNYPLVECVINYFGKHSISRDQFMQLVDRTYVSYPRNVNQAMFNLLESHDTSRLMYLCSEDSRKARLAYLFMLTQAGSPCIYYGGEVGMSGGRIGVSESNRRCMVWDPELQDKEMYGFIQEIIRLRHSGEDLKSPVIHWIDAQHDHCIAYQRGNIEIFINNSDIEINVVIQGIVAVLPPFGYAIERRITAYLP
jgi:glycosidase